MANGTLKVSNIQTSSGSGTITLGQSGETVTIPSGATVSGAMSNTPAFLAYVGSNQSISDSSWTKITYDTETFDSDGCYDTSAYRFTPTVAGKYFIHAKAVVYSDNNDTLNGLALAVYKNGSSFLADDATNGSHQPTRASLSKYGTVELNGSSDYVEMYVYIDNGNSGNRYVQASTKYCTFGAQRLIGA